jgi:pimeloyl-ACP methyl ester carboxylesterase
LIDQRGHGASDWGGGPDVSRATDDLLFVIDRLGPIHAVVGHSYGALVALEAARRATSEEIPCLAVYEPALSVRGPIMDDDSLRRMEAAAASGDFEAVLRLQLGSPIGGMSEAEVDDLASNPMLRAAYADLVVQAPSIAPALVGCMRLDDAEPYRKIDVPTLLLLGSVSVPNPFHSSIDALHDVLPDSQVAVLEGQGHMAVLFAPHLVAHELRQFLAVPRAP